MNQEYPEPRVYSMYLSLTRSERAAVERLAAEHGATLSGIVRKLIRDAAGLSKSTPESFPKEAANANAQ